MVCMKCGNEDNFNIDGVVIKCGRCGTVIKKKDDGVVSK